MRTQPDLVAGPACPHYRAGFRWPQYAAFLRHEGQTSETASFAGSPWGRIRGWPARSWRRNPRLSARGESACISTPQVSWTGVRINPYFAMSTGSAAVPRSRIPRSIRSLNYCRHCRCIVQKGYQRVFPLEGGDPVPLETESSASPLPHRDIARQLFLLMAQLFLGLFARETISSARRRSSIPSSVRTISACSGKRV